MSQTPKANKQTKRFITITGTNNNHFYVENVIKAQHKEKRQQLREILAAHDTEKCFSLKDMKLSERLKKKIVRSPRPIEKWAKVTSSSQTKKAKQS